MALISDSNYKPPVWLFNEHLETIYPPLFRKISIHATPKKIIINTPDHDYFDLHYYDNNSNRTLIISHGLEGNNERPYVIGMAKMFFEKGWNVIAWNYRGCNGKINNSVKSYHSGFTEDLEEVIKYASKPHIQTISLVGFSLGGNLTLKYLGGGNQVSGLIKSAVVFSVPLDLHQGCLEISKPGNFIYSARFLKSLKQKVRDKAKKYPELQIQRLSGVHDLLTFDEHFTAPIHGFKGALDYYQSCSSLYVLDRIEIPTLILNALNDPFLPQACYPYEILKSHKYVSFETPARGGHVGFCSLNGSEFYWSEKRAYEFIESKI
jgi:predicted alpha/beta-fold hydrolase